MDWIHGKQQQHTDQVEFSERLVDEEQGDKGSENVLGELGEVLHQG